MIWGFEYRQGFNWPLFSYMFRWKSQPPKCYLRPHHRLERDTQTKIWCEILLKCIQVRVIIQQWSPYLNYQEYCRKKIIKKNKITKTRCKRSIPFQFRALFEWPSDLLTVPRCQMQNRETENSDADSQEKIAWCACPHENRIKRVCGDDLRKKTDRENDYSWNGHCSAAFEWKCMLKIDDCDWFRFLNEINVRESESKIWFFHYVALYCFCMASSVSATLL